MNFYGLWKCSSNETFKISESAGDFYLLEHDLNGDNFKSSKIVPIFNSNSKHALLAHSVKFGRQDIIIINPDCFSIRDLLFWRK